MSRPSTQTSSAGAAMTTPAQLERLGEYLRKLRLLKSGERLEALDANLMEIRSLSSAFTEKFASADDATQSQYLEKMKADGELAAMRWLVNGK
jgi:hypothetical protein